MMRQINELCSNVYSGGTPNKKHLEYYENGVIPWLNTGEIQFKKIYKTEKYISEIGLKASAAKWVPENAVIVAMYGATAGRTAITKIPLTTNQACCNLVINPEVADYRYVYYYLCSKYSHIASLANGGAQQNLNAGQIKEYPIDLPDLMEQRKVAGLLEIFDDKIELNERINNNLEQQLEALFIYNFADDIANVSTENCPTLGNVVNVIDNRGKTPPLTSEYFEYPIIDVGALKGAGRIVDFNNCTKYVEKDTYETWFRSGHPKPMDILISTVGSLAEMKIYLGSKGCIAQNVVALRTKAICPLYLYQYLRYIRADLVAYNIGSVQPSIKVTHIIKHPIFVPESSKLESFEETAKAITEQLYANYCEIEALKELRDTLLPQLMSGEIDVSNIIF